MSDYYIWQSAKKNYSTTEAAVDATGSKYANDPVIAQALSLIKVAELAIHARMDLLVGDDNDD